MKKFLLSTAASLAAVTFVSAPAMAATEIVLESNPSNDVLSADFGDTVQGPGSFTDEYFFATPAGFTSAQISTITVMGFADIDFTSALLNGVALDLFSGPNGGDFASISNLFVAGGRNTLVINGMVEDGIGSYGGTISFVPSSAVPEPGTWALMLLGFAAVGFSLRRRKPESRETRVRYNFA